MNEFKFCPVDVGCAERVCAGHVVCLSWIGLVRKGGGFVLVSPWCVLTRLVRVECAHGTGFYYISRGRNRRGHWKPRNTRTRRRPRYLSSGLICTVESSKFFVVVEFRTLSVFG